MLCVFLSNSIIPSADRERNWNEYIILKERHHYYPQIEIVAVQLRLKTL